MAGTHNPGTGEPETGGSLRLAGLLCLVSFKPIRDPVSKKKIKIKGWAGFRVPELINQASVAAACNPSTGAAKTGTTGKTGWLDELESANSGFS